MLELHPQWQAWAGQVRDILREAAAAVEAARNDGQDQPGPELLAGLRARYDDQVAWGITTNRLRDWHKGNHPGCNLAKRLQDKAGQVWLFAGNFQIPWTNNASEQALKGPKRHQAVSGYWHTTTTLADYCRVRSYLVSARGHGIRATDAIHAALTGRPWLPVPVTALHHGPAPVNGHLPAPRSAHPAGCSSSVPGAWGARTAGWPVGRARHPS